MMPGLGPKSVLRLTLVFATLPHAFGERQIADEEAMPTCQEDVSMLQVKVPKELKQSSVAVEKKEYKVSSEHTHAENEKWLVEEGDCMVYGDDCLTSPNYGGSSNYENDEGCRVINKGGNIRVVAFSTERYWDKVTIGDNNQISGTIHANHVLEANAGDIVEWSSDSSVVKSGWKFCGAPSTSPAPPPENEKWRVEEGDCMVYGDDCLTSPNYGGSSNYENEEWCRVINKGGNIRVVAFSTERYWDKVTIGDNNQISGTIHANRVLEADAGDIVQWSSDSSVVKKGWKFCGVPSSSPAPTPEPVTPSPTAEPTPTPEPVTPSPTTGPAPEPIFEPSPEPAPADT